MSMCSMPYKLIILCLQDMSRKTHNPGEKVEYLPLSSIFIVGNIDNMMRNSFRFL